MRIVRNMAAVGVLWAAAAMQTAELRADDSCEYMRDNARSRAPDRILVSGGGAGAAMPLGVCATRKSGHHEGPNMTRRCWCALLSACLAGPAVSLVAQIQDTRPSFEVASVKRATVQRYPPLASVFPGGASTTPPPPSLSWLSSRTASWPSS